MNLKHISFIHSFRPPPCILLQNASFKTLHKKPGIRLKSAEVFCFSSPFLRLRLSRRGRIGRNKRRTVTLGGNWERRGVDDGEETRLQKHRDADGVKNLLLELFPLSDCCQKLRVQPRQRKTSSSLPTREVTCSEAVSQTRPSQPCNKTQPDCAS